MYKLAVLVALLGVASAQQRFNQQPQARNPAADATILRSENENQGDGNFRWAFETSDGTRAEQSGYIKNPGAPQDETIQVIQGAYSHYSPEGELYQVNYVADENGFVPQGSHLPTPPPIPEAIQKSLDIIYRNAASQQQQQRGQNNNNFRG